MNLTTNLMLAGEHEHNLQVEAARVHLALAAKAGAQPSSTGNGPGPRRLVKRVALPGGPGPANRRRDPLIESEAPR